MDLSLSFAIFSLTTGIIWGLPPFGHHDPTIHLGTPVTLEQIEREIAEARDPLAIPTWEPCPGGDCRWRPSDAPSRGP